MSFKYILTGIIVFVQVAALIYLVRRYMMQKKLSANIPADVNNDSYEALRNTALAVSLTQLNLMASDDRTVVYGVVMDCNLGNGIVTLTAYITGAANIYFSTGEKKTGGGKSPEVGEAAIDFVMAAQHYVDRAIKVVTTELPQDGCVRFYLLTSKGLYAAQDQLLHISDATSPWVILFDKGNEVMELMRNSGNGSIPH